MWALVGDKQRFRLWKHGTANCVGLVRETASDLVALKWLRRRRRRNIIDTHHSVAGRTEQANVSVELPHPPEFRLSFLRTEKSGASNAAARKVAVAVQGRTERRKEGGRNGKTVLKFPLAATAAAAAAAVRVGGLLVCRLHRRGGCDDGNDEQSERPRERGLKGLETALASRGLDSLAGRKPYSFSISFSPRPRTPIPS